MSLQFPLNQKETLELNSFEKINYTYPQYAANYDKIETPFRIIVSKKTTQCMSAMRHLLKVHVANH